MHQVEELIEFDFWNLCLKRKFLFHLSLSFVKNQAYLQKNVYTARRKLQSQLAQFPVTPCFSVAARIQNLALPATIMSSVI